MSNERVFISYATENRALVDEYIKAFRLHGIDVWIDHEQIRYGDLLIERLEEAIATCRYAVIFHSSAYVRKVYTDEERQALLRMQIESNREGQEERAIFVVRLDDAELSPFLANRLWSGGAGPQTLAEAIGRRLRVEPEMPAPCKELDVVTFAGRLEGPALEMLARQLLQGLQQLRQTDEPAWVKAHVPGTGRVECECLPKEVAQWQIEDLEGRMKLCGIHRRLIRGYQDQLAKGGLGIYDGPFRIRLDEEIAELDVVRFGKDGIRDLLNGLILRVKTLR